MPRSFEIGINFILLPLVASAIDYQSTHVITVCDASHVWYTNHTSPLPPCPFLPQPTNFLNFDPYQKLFQSNQCSSKLKISEDNGTPIEKAIRFLKRLIDSACNSLLGKIKTLTRETLQNNQKWVHLSEQWSHELFTIQSLVLFTLLNVKRKSYAVNLILSVILASVLYPFLLLTSLSIFHLLLFTFGSLFIFSNGFYKSSSIDRVGLLTLFFLIMPVTSSVSRVLVEILLLIPIINLIFNGLSVVAQVACLIGLYIDEKLLIVKTLFLPLFKMFDTFFDANIAHESFLEAVYQSVEELTRDFIEGSGDLDERLRAKLEKLCLKATNEWYERCPVFFKGSCVTAVNQTVISQADRGFETVGQWLTVVLTGAPVRPVQRKAAETICFHMTESACDISKINLTSYCSPSGSLAYGRAYQYFLNATSKLKSLITFQSKAEISEFSSETTTFDVNFDWLSWLQSVATILLLIALIAYVWIAIAKALVFSYRYKNDLKFCNNKKKFSFKFKFLRLCLLFKVLSFFSLEGLMAWLHLKLQNIEFQVPENGEVNLLFDVQGEGTLANVLKSLLSNFSLQSRYCSSADTSVCKAPFFKTSIVFWSVLFLLSVFHFLIEMFKAHSDYFLCKICDKFNQEHAARRTAVSLEIKEESLRKRKLLIESLAKEAITRPSFNKKLVRFYENAKYRWYNRAPTLLKSWIAHNTYGIQSLNCQICYQKEIVYSFDCESLLFCDECCLSLENCPRDTCCELKTLRI